MTVRALLARGLNFYSDHGAIRTIGVGAKFCGTEIAHLCGRIGQMRERDRGRGYPLRLRLRAARHGLSAHAYLWLGLGDADVDADRYLTTVDPIRDLNGGHIIPIHDKYTFQLLTEPYVGSLPALYGTLDGGEFAAPREPRRNAGLFDVLEREGAVVLKPTTGKKGHGIYVLERSGGGFLVNDRPADRAEVADLAAGLDGYIVTEFVRQHAYAASIFPDATNTLRVFSIVDPDTGAPRVLRATHRFGSAESAPTDNWSRGGYCAPVDVGTGELGHLVHLDGSRRSKVEEHPESGNRVRGVTVPYWDEVCRLVRDAAILHGQAPFVGWDVVVSEDGPILLEGNARPGRVLLQLERGVFEDESVRRLLDADDAP